MEFHKLENYPVNIPKRIIRVQTPGTTGESWKKENVCGGHWAGVLGTVSVQTLNWGLPLSPSLYKCTFFFDRQTEKCEKY